MGFTYQGLLVLQRSRLHPFPRRRRCRRGRCGRHLGALSSCLPVLLGLRPGLSSRPAEPAPAPVPSPQPGRPSAECDGSPGARRGLSLPLASPPRRAGRGRCPARCSAPTHLQGRPGVCTGAASGCPERRQRAHATQSRTPSPPRPGIDPAPRGCGAGRGRVCWHVEGTGSPEAAALCGRGWRCGDSWTSVGGY